MIYCVKFGLQLNRKKKGLSLEYIQMKSNSETQLNKINSELCLKLIWIKKKKKFRRFWSVCDSQIQMVARSLVAMNGGRQSWKAGCKT